MKHIPWGRCAYLALVGAVFMFVLSPLIVIIWASTFADKVLQFPPSGYTVSGPAAAASISFYNGDLVIEMELAQAGRVDSQQFSRFTSRKCPQFLSCVRHEACTHVIFKRDGKAVGILLNDLVNPANASHTAPVAPASRSALCRATAAFRFERSAP